MDHFSQISYLMVEANSTCNLHCITCNRDELVEKGFRPNKNLSVTEFRSILEQVKSCPIDTIKFEGISEPMMHSQFDKLCQVLREYFPSAFVIIATNLQYNLAKVPFLSSLNYVDMVYLSIDGIHERYEQARVGAKYSKLIQSLESIKQHVSKEVCKTKLHINFTLTPQNYKDVPAMYELKEKYNLASVRINLAQNWSEDQLNKHYFDDAILNFLQPYVEDVKGVAGWEYKDCFWPKSGVIIDVYGDVRQCIINTSQHPIGNLHQQPLRDIYNNSILLKQARENLAKNCPPQSCINCDYNYLSPILKKLFAKKNFNNLPRKVANDK